MQDANVCHVFIDEKKISIKASKICCRFYDSSRVCMLIECKIRNIQEDMHLVYIQCQDLDAFIEKKAVRTIIICHFTPIIISL